MLRRTLLLCALSCAAVLGLPAGAPSQAAPQVPAASHDSPQGPEETAAHDEGCNATYPKRCGAASTDAARPGKCCPANSVCCRARGAKGNKWRCVRSVQECESLTMR